ncbi:MAG TPA: hypothetical protein VN259_03005, partial [Xanthomonadales bacterium]|nr:hypothetical protein [Xanthomonadales bacterium]
NLNFRSISTNGSVNGINLDTTGAAGGLVVSGTNNVTQGGDSSGGTFRTTGDAIRLVDTQGVSLTNIRIANVGTGPADQAGGIDATNLRGTNLLRASTITDMGKAGGSGGTNRNAISVINSNTNLTQFTVENSVFSNSEGTSSFIFTSARFASNMSISVTGSDFFNLVPIAVQVNAGDEDSGVHTVTSNISNNTFRNAHVSNGQGGIIVATADQDATHNFTIAGNQFFDLIKGIAGGNSEIVATQTTGGRLAGTISGNTLGTTAFANGDRRGIGIIAEPDVSANGELGSVDVVIEGNFINRLPTREAIFVDLREDTGNSELIIRNNNIGNLAGFEGQVGGTREAIDVQTRGEVARTLDLLVSGNNVRSNTDTPFSVMNLEVNIDNGTPGDLTMNATVTGNTFTNSGTGNELFARARDAGTVTTLCLNMSANTVGAGAGVLDLDDVGELNVQQASAAALAAANGIPAGNVVITSGAPVFGVACPAPPL